MFRRNWKTTLSGLVLAMGTILPQFGISVEVANSIATVGGFLLGLFAKDGNVTGGTTPQ